MKQKVVSIALFSVFLGFVTTNSYSQGVNSIKPLQHVMPKSNISLTEAATLFTTQPSRASILNYTTVTGGIYNYTSGALSQPTSLSSTASIEFLPSSQLEIVVFPNPNKGIFNVKGLVSNEQSVNIIVTNLAGKVVYQSLTNAFDGHFSYQVQLGQGLAPGQYNLMVIAGSQKIMQRVLVEN